MDEALRAAVVAVGVFAATNVDDLVVVTVLFLAARPNGVAPRRLREWNVWAGQFAGIGVLVGVSLVAAASLRVVPDRWIGLAGIVPFAIGLYALIRTLRDGDDDDAAVVANGVAAVGALTIANGADNVAVYAPTFRSIGAVDTATMLAVFGVCVALMCLGGRWLGSRRVIVALVDRWGRWVVPIVFMAIGIAIILESS